MIACWSSQPDVLNRGEFMVLPRFVVALFLATMAILGAGPAHSQATSTGSGQAFPTKSIRVVTGQPGGGSDLVARLLANGITEGLGQPMIIENRPGGVIPLEIVQKAPPDGYTLLVYSNGLWLLPFMQANVRFDPVRDFAPVSLVTNSPNILVVHPSLAANSVKELISPK
jgi:tripartite-type tricarboxylate transporter receptor subunit TctC